MPHLRFTSQQLLFCCLAVSVSSIWSGFWMCTRTMPPRCVYWFSWLPTNNFWSIASLSRLMLCGWLMSATINVLMLPRSSAPRTKPFHMSHSGIQWQAEACLYWQAFVFSLSFTPSFFLTGSLIQSVSPALSLFKPFSISLSLNGTITALDL